MLPFLIFVISGLLAGLLLSWRRNRKLLAAQALSATQVRVDERTNELERANEDLKRDHAELRRRWEYLAEAQRLSHAGTFGWKVRSGQIVWSDETYRILGFTRETNPTLDLVLDRVHPDDLDRVRMLSDRAAQNGMDLEVEHRILLSDGVIKYVHAVAHAGRDSSGNLEYMGVVTDITEHKLADEEREALSRDLQESKAWLEEAQRVAHLGYWVWDLQTNQLIWSDETYRIFGLSPQEGIIDLDKVREMIHPDDRETVFRTAEEAVRSGVRADCEHRLFRPNGEMRVVHSLADLKRDASGRPRKMFGTTQDITDRKRVDEDRQALSNALQQSNARLEEAQRLAHIGHYEWDLIDNRVRYSEELCRIWGIPPAKDSFDVSVIFERIHPDDREKVSREAAEAISNGTHAKSEHRIVLPSGEVRVILGLGTVKRDASGKAYEMYRTNKDITERKLAEQALRQSQFYLSEGERLAHIGSWASTDLGIHWSEDLNIYWSDEVYKIFGFDPKNGTPSLQQFLSAVHHEDQASLTATMKKLHEEHCGCDVTNRIIRPDGEIRYVRCVGIPVVEDGVFKGYRGTTMDVTEQELLTQELRREQAYLAEAQRLTHTGSWAANFVTGQNVHLSDETVRMHGFDP